VRASARALERGGFAAAPLSFLIAMTAVISVLVALTVLATF
jgi:hypothetical protein